MAVVFAFAFAFVGGEALLFLLSAASSQAHLLHHLHCHAAGAPGPAGLVPAHASVFASLWVLVAWCSFQVRLLNRALRLCQTVCDFLLGLPINPDSVKKG